MADYESQQTSILARAVKRLGLQLPPMVKNLRVSDTMQLQASVDDLLTVTHNEALLGTTDPGATGYEVLHTVPANVRQRFLYVRVTKVGGATITFTNLHLTIRGGIGSVFMTSAAAIDQFYVLEHLFWLKPGDYLQVYVSAYTAGDTMNASAIYQETPLTGTAS